MNKGSLRSSYDWVNFTQLERSMSRQNKNSKTNHKSHNFDPHKYFGGWEPIERTSIERIKQDNRLIEMMEFEATSVALSKSWSDSIISESLATPSIAEELEPANNQLKTNNLIDFKIKTETLHDNNIKHHKPTKKIVSNSRSKHKRDILTPHVNNLGWVLSWTIYI